MKSIVLISGTELVLLPQTIGPFKTRLARAAAGAILRRARAVYCRDSESLTEAERVAGPRRTGCLRYAADVSFLVEPEKPEDVSTVAWAEARRRDGVLVGLNVSGLLAGGGYTGRNQFGLRGDYVSFVAKAAGALLAEENVSLLFLPHVFGLPGAMENDLDACRTIAGMLSEDARARTRIPDGLVTAGQAKHLAGLCEFFAGSRMHSCLAALSQGVPTVGIAYSKKFCGVFESLGVGDMVVDFTKFDEARSVKYLIDAFRDRKRIRDRLTVAIEEAKASARAAFGEILDAAEGGS